MKKIVILSAIFLSGLSFAQNVIWNEVAKTHDNTDAFLYRIANDAPAALYLGEVEIQGYHTDDVEVFRKVYAKAKEVGANAFAYHPFETVDGTESAFDPAHYKLRMYYVPVQDLPAHDNMLYLFSSPVSEQKIAFNKERLTFEPRTFTKRKLQPGETYTLSTRKLLGSTVKFSAEAGAPVQYFQMQALRVASNPYGEAGIHLKSGDIIRLERSFAEFLTVIYREF